MLNDTLSWDDVESQLILLEKRLSHYRSVLTDILQTTSHLGAANKDIGSKLAKYTASQQIARTITLRFAWDILQSWDGSRWDNYVEGHTVEFSVSATGLVAYLKVDQMMNAINYEDGVITFRADGPATLYFPKNQEFKRLKLLPDQIGVKIPVSIALAGRHYRSELHVSMSIHYARGGRRMLSPGRDARLFQLPAILKTYKKEIQNKIDDECVRFFKLQSASAVDSFAFYSEVYDVRTIGVDSHLSFYAQKPNYEYRNRGISGPGVSKPLHQMKSRITIREPIFMKMLHSMAPSSSGGRISTYWFQDSTRTVPDPHGAGSVLHRFLFEVRINNRPSTPTVYFFRFAGVMEGSNARIYMQIMRLKGGLYEVFGEKTIYYLFGVSEVEVASDAMEIMISYS